MKSLTAQSIVHLITMQSLWEADQMSILLQQHFFESFIPDEHSISNGLLRNNLHKGVELKMFKKDHANALSTLKEKGCKFSNTPNIIYSEQFQNFSKKFL